MKLTFRERKIDPVLTMFLSVIIAGVIFFVPFFYHSRADLISNDEQTLLSQYSVADSCRIISGTLDTQQAYVCSAYLLRGIGATAADGPLYGAILSVALTFLPLLKSRRVSTSIFLVACTWGIIRAIFLSVLSKDLVSSFVILIAMLFGSGRFFGWAWFLPAMFYGWVVRKYWIIVACLWFVLCRVRKCISPWTMVLGIFLFYLALAFVLNSLMGQSLQFTRQSMNENRDIGAHGAQTVIQPIISSNNPVLAAVDTVITFFRLIFPIETLRIPSVQKLGFLLIMPITFWWMVKTVLNGVNSKVPGMVAAGKIALAPFSFLIVEAVFEPDFGSFARHFSMVSPLVFYALALSSRQPTNDVK